MNIRQAVIATTLTLAFSMGASAASQADYQAALSSAQSALATADKMGSQWRDSGKLLKKAEGAASKGDFAKAKELAEKAASQGRLAQQQAMEQANAGNPSYLY